MVQGWYSSSDDGDDVDEDDDGGGDDGNCVCLHHAREKLFSIGCVVMLLSISGIISFLSNQNKHEKLGQEQSIGRESERTSERTNE